MFQSIRPPDPFFEVDYEAADSIKDGSFYSLTGVDRGKFKILHEEMAKEKEKAEV